MTVRTKVLDGDHPCVNEAAGFIEQRSRELDRHLAEGPR